MRQSLIKTYIHIIFSTKQQVPFILQAYEQELHNCIAKICIDLRCRPLNIGRSTEHIHILCTMSPNISLEKLLEGIKSNSSKWMKTKHESLKNFNWQDGYGAFSINEIKVKEVVDYITDQHAYHADKSFQEEYRSILDKYEVEYDEQDLWD